MLAKCANPACNAPFLYYRDGKLYQMEVADTAPGVATADDQSATSPDRKPVRRLEFFWLCGRCAPQMTLVVDEARGVVTVPIRPQRAAAL